MSGTAVSHRITAPPSRTPEPDRASSVTVRRLWTNCLKCGGRRSGTGLGPHAPIWRRQPDGHERVVDCVGDLVDAAAGETGGAA